MTTELWADNTSTTLSGNGGTLAAGATSFKVASATGFPTPGASQQFRCSLGQGAAAEVVTVTNVTGTTFTCSATANSHSDGDVVAAIIANGALSNLVQLSPSAAQSGSINVNSTVTGTALIPSGLTGSTAAGRFVGFTASGAPASGAHSVGDVAGDQTGKLWMCTGAGTPGTFTQIGGGGSATLSGIYGDGSDGALTFDGTTTILGVVPSASTYTLTRDIFPSAMTVNNGVTIITNCYRIWCAGVLTNNGTIQWNGTAASGRTAGTAIANNNGTLNASNYPGTAGGIGANVANGTAGTNQTTASLGGGGGAGGNAGANTGGGGGTVVAPTAIMGSLRDVFHLALSRMISGGTPQAIYGGAGGGGGASDGFNNGGGGGAGGGIVILFAQSFAGTGAIQARGGRGGDSGGNNCAGGGGGGGGFVGVVSGSASGGAITGQTIDASGGAHGTPTGTGGTGSAGTNGTVVILAP